MEAKELGAGRRETKRRRMYSHNVTAYCCNNTANKQSARNLRNCHAKELVRQAGPMDRDSEEIANTQTEGELALDRLSGTFICSVKIPFEKGKFNRD